MAAYGKPVMSPQLSNRDRTTVPRACYNCGKDGHLSSQCQEPLCSKCSTTWNSIRAPGYHHNSRCPQHQKGGVARQSSALPQGCLNCAQPGHDISKCMKPICYKCGTTWLSKSNPGYHHFSNCPHPQVRQPSLLGKRPNPYGTHQQRAHMSALRELLLAEPDNEQTNEHIQRSDWSDDEDQEEPWQEGNM